MTDPAPPACPEGVVIGGGWIGQQEEFQRVCWCLLKQHSDRNSHVFDTMFGRVTITRRQPT